MQKLTSTWGSLFGEAVSEKLPKALLVEEGYYLFVVPNITQSDARQKAKITIEHQRLQTCLLSLKEGVHLPLAKLSEFDFDCTCDYHTWARKYAARIDSKEIRAEAYVDMTVFLRKLHQLSASYGFEVWQDKQDSKRVEINCYWFRQPINLYRQVAKMVSTGKAMGEEISDLLREISDNCQMLLNYYEEFAKSFSEYRVFVGDHHFVASRSQHDLAPGFDYWALLANPKQTDLTFWRGVEAVRQFLAFSKTERKNVH